MRRSWPTPLAVVAGALFIEGWALLCHGKVYMAFMLLFFITIGGEGLEDKNENVIHWNSLWLHVGDDTTPSD